jgi:hypothetical protein
MTNAAGLHLDAHLPWARLGDLALDDLETCSGFRNLRDRHLLYHGYGYFHCCHTSSYKSSMVLVTASRARLLVLFDAKVNQQNLKIKVRNQI